MDEFVIEKYIEIIIGISISMSPRGTTGLSFRILEDPQYFGLDYLL